MSKRNLTIDDVAKAAGVARVTVSRVLNNEPNVRPQTRSRVHEAVQALGYSVNMQARALASGIGRQIMLVHAHDPDQEPNSYYHAGLELGALRACSSLGFDLVTRAVDPHSGSPASLLLAILERERPTGVVLSPPLADDIELLAQTRRLGLRVVAISAAEEARALVPSVGIDERFAGRTIGEHLLSLGHRQFGFVAGPDEHRSAALRYDGFLDAMRAADLVAEPWTVSGDFTFKSGVEATERLLRDGVEMTALACANDDMAAGAMLALHRASIDIPADISVTGFDDTPMSEIIWPPLTTIRQPIKQLAERAVHLLMQSEHPAGEQPFCEIIPYELVVRESTACVS